ncbi:MAG: immunoglobulin domain-containing protein [Blastocatellia bacterium]
MLIGQGKQRPTSKVQESQVDRNGRIAKVSIHPGDVTVQVGETVQFTAVARDRNDLAIPGATFIWSGNDLGRNRSLTISQKGEFIARVAGVYQVRAESGVHQNQVKVTVTGGDPRGREVRPQRVIDVSSRDLPKISSLNPSGKTPAGKAPKSPANRVPSGFSARVGSSFLPGGTEVKSKSPSKAAAAAFLPDPTEWNETNIQLADDPGRERAPDVPNRVSSAGAGSGNFSFSAPLVSMAGRGLNLSLALNYNSRLWNRIGNEMVFNIDKDWPTPGFSLGFGKIVGTGDAGGYMIVEADGLHRSQQGRTAVYTYSQGWRCCTNEYCRYGSGSLVSFS